MVQPIRDNMSVAPSREGGNAFPVPRLIPLARPLRKLAPKSDAAPGYARHIHPYKTLSVCVKPVSTFILRTQHQRAASVQWDKPVIAGQTTFTTWQVNS